MQDRFKPIAQQLRTSEAKILGNLAASSGVLITQIPLLLLFLLLRRRLPLQLPLRFLLIQIKLDRTVFI